MSDVRPDPATAEAVALWWRRVGANRGRLTSSYLGMLRSSLPAGDAMNDPADPDTPVWLLESVLWAVEAGPSQAALAEDTWHEAGRRLAGQGVPESTFAMLGRILVRAVRDAAGDDWSGPVSSGWSAFHLWTQHHLMLGAAEAEPAVTGSAVPAAVLVTESPSPPPPPPRAGSRPGTDIYQAWGRGWV